MDIEEIEKLVAEQLDAIKKTDGVSALEAWSVMQCQLLLHIYRKLEAIEEQGQTEPGKWK